MQLTDSFKIDICCKLLETWKRGGVVTSFYIRVVMVGWSISPIAYSQTVNSIKQWISQVLQPTCYLFQKKRYRGSWDGVVASCEQSWIKIINCSKTPRKSTWKHYLAADQLVISTSDLYWLINIINCWMSVNESKRVLLLLNIIKTFKNKIQIWLSNSNDL